MTGFNPEGGGAAVQINGVDVDFSDCHFSNGGVDIEATDSSLRVTRTKFSDQAITPSEPKNPAHAPERSRTTKGWTPGFRLPGLGKKGD